MGGISSWLKFGGAGLLGFAATLPLVGGSCGRTACLVVGPGESACPTPKEAFMRIAVQGCTGPVTSVDGAGERDGDLCCYPVTRTDHSLDCSGGFGGFGGSSQNNAGGSSGGPDCALDGESCSFDSDCCSSACRSDGFCGGCAQSFEPCDPNTDQLTFMCCEGLTCDGFNQCE